MKTAFLSETQYRGKWPKNFPNARTEVAWQIALDADHFNIMDFSQVSGYDWVMVIFPKGGVSLNSEGIRLNDQPNRFSSLFAMPFIEDLKKRNKKVAYIQEGPTWFVNDFSLPDQFNFFNQLAECDVIFAHNDYDTRWYEVWFPQKKVTTIPTLMIEELIRNISPIPENKAIIGGNFCRWYGGFQSYIVASEFENDIHVQTSHASQPGEEQIPGLYVMPRVSWFEWIKMLSTFKYAVHMMPTVAAGTFSLNCAYLGIPCIGNRNVDTQRICFPLISVEAEDVKLGRYFAKKLKTDPGFYNECSEQAKLLYKNNYSLDIWQKKMYAVLENL